MGETVLIKYKKLNSDWWILAYALTFFASLYFNSDIDIIALNAPHDDYWHIHKSLNFFSPEPFNSMVNIHSPIYAFWIYATNKIGVPLVLGVSVICLISFLYLSYVLLLITGNRLFSLLLFVLLAFNPFSFFINNRALAETLLVPLIAIAFASMIHLIFNDKHEIKKFKKPLTMIFLSSFSLAYYIRKEGVVLIPFLLCGYLYFRHECNDKFSLKNYFKTFIFPVISTCVVLSVLLSSYNFIKFDKFEKSSLYNSNYQRLMKSLISIDLGSAPYQVSVSTRMLDAAFENSPTLNELKPAFNGSIGSMWKDISSNFIDAKGEIASGWFYWALRDSAQFAGWFRSPQLSDEKFALAADEIDQAFFDRRLKKRSLVFDSFLDPDYGKWLPHLPHSIIAVSKTMWPQYHFGLSPQENATESQFYEYFLSAGRRRPAQLSQISGWVQAPEGSSLSVGNTKQILIGPERPDVKGALPFKLVSKTKLSGTTIDLRIDEHNHFTLNTDDLRVGKVIKFNKINGPDIGIDTLQDIDVNTIALKNFKFLVDVSQIATFILTISILFAIPIVLFKFGSQYTAVFLIGFVLVASRVLLFAILDSSSWSGAQIRYLYPAQPILMFTGFVSICIIYKTILMFYNRKI